jgi:hypothetical protein
MADRKPKHAAANRRRLERLTRKLSRVERQIACLQHQSGCAIRDDLLVERQVVLFAKHSSHHMH